MQVALSPERRKLPDERLDCTSRGLSKSYLSPLVRLSPSSCLGVRDRGPTPCCLLLTRGAEEETVATVEKVA